MNPIVAFVVVMAVWTVSEFVARKTKSLLSSLFVASLIFLVGFLSGIFPEDLLAASSLLALAGVVVGFIIVHLGTVISLDDFKKQWKTFLIGFSTVIGIGIALWLASLIFGGRISGSAEAGYAQALDLVVEGGGRGVMEKRGRPAGLGLLGMRERLVECGGTVTISDRPAVNGALLVARVPWPVERMEAR